MFQLYHLALHSGGGRRVPMLALGGTHAHPQEHACCHCPTTYHRGAVCPQALRRLNLLYSSSALLPLADFFPNLETLEQSTCVPPAWLGRLPRLGRLQEAHLAIGFPEDWAGNGGGGEEGGAVAVSFPPMPSLTRLTLDAEAGVGSLQLLLAGMPALRELILRRDRQGELEFGVDLAAGGAPPRLERVEVPSVPTVTADFRLLPALREMWLGHGQLAGAASIAAAAALARLRLGEMDHWELGRPTFQSCCAPRRPP